MAPYLQTPTGAKTQQVRIEQSVLVPDGEGGHTQGWALRAVVWALVEPLTSREALQAKQLTAVLNTALTIGFRDDVHVTDRILIRSRVLHISSYQDETGRRIELRILCSEVQDAPLVTGAVVSPSWIQAGFTQ